MEQFLTHVMVPKLTAVIADVIDKKICQVPVPLDSHDSQAVP